MIVKALLGLLVFVGSVGGAALPQAYAADQPAATALDKKININTASRSGLMKLKGVGKEVADKIIEYREKNGSFKTPEEIRKVSGIGKGIWEANREAIAVK